MSSKLMLTRRQLAAFLPDSDAIQAFERVFKVCDAAEDAVTESNPYGTAVILSDGTMIVYGVKAAISISTPSGALFADYFDFTFPKAFLVRPVVVPSCEMVAGAIVLPGCYDNLTETGFRGYILSTTSVVHGYLSYIAIGPVRP